MSAAPAPKAMISSPALTLASVSAGYDNGAVIRDVELTVQRGEVVALLGPNGAGKSTLLKAAAGLVRPSTGTVTLGGRDVTSWAPYRRRRAGLCLVPEGRGIFPNLSVRENLRLQVPRRDRGAAVDRVLSSFPDLAGRLAQQAGSMSGGQQQMLALARCYLRPSDIVLIDEASMGLAPKVVDEVYAALDAMRSAGRAVLVVEQFVDRALAVADAVYVLGHGTATRLGPPSRIDRDELMQLYLGTRGSTTPYTSDH